MRLLKVSSSAFKDGGEIPSEFTCDGLDLSPPLSITDVPKETTTLSIIMDDPDAPMGTFTHWLVWNISPNKTQFTKGEEFSSVQGRTSFGATGYGGPCPPSGTHRYFFKVYALDTKLNLNTNSRKENVERTMEGHILAKGEIVGLYRRS